MANKPKFEILDTIPNPTDFSKTCSEVFNQGSIDLQIHWSPTWGYGPGLKVIPQQFHPTFHQAAKIHLDEHPRFTRAWVHLNQGELDADETFRISRVHFDAWLEGYPETGYPNNDVFIVSDALPTQFSTQCYDMTDLVEHESNDLNILAIERLEGQVDEEAFITPDVYQLARCDSYTVHRAQIPKHKTRRTFMMVRFY